MVIENEMNENGVVRNDLGRSDMKVNTRYPRKGLLLAAGLLYLGLIVLGIIAQVTKMGLVVSGDPAATVQNITASGGALGIVFACGMASHACYLLLGGACYLIFKDIDQRVANLMLAFVIVSGAISVINTLNIFDAMQIMNGQAVVTTADADLVLQQLTAHTDGELVAQVFGWGPWLVPLGYLAYRSGYAPKPLGVVLMVGGAGLTFQAIQHFLMPGMGDISTPGVMISMIAEFTFCPWLIYRGIKGFAVTDGHINGESVIPETL